MPDGSFKPTELFQLNLMILLSLPGRADYPIFYANGFELHLIEDNIMTPPAALLRARNAQPPIPMLGNPSPDLLVRNDLRQHVIPLECKLNSFSTGSTGNKIPQANALLACTGADIANYFAFPAPPNWTAGTMYAVMHDKQGQMAATLDALAIQLETANIVTFTHRPTSFGIEVKEDGIYLHFWDTSRMPFKVDPVAKVIELAPDEHPQVLYIIPVHPSIVSRDAEEDTYGEQVLTERLRAALAQRIVAQLRWGEVTIDWYDLMTDAIVVWPNWGEEGKQNLLRPFKGFVRSVFRAFNKQFGTQTDESRFRTGIVLRNIEASRIPRIVNYLRSDKYRKGEIDLSLPLQLPLEYQE